MKLLNSCMTHSRNKQALVTDCAGSNMVNIFWESHNCYLFHEPFKEWNNRKIYKVREIFIIMWEVEKQLIVYH